MKMKRYKNITAIAYLSLCSIGLSFAESPHWTYKPIDQAQWRALEDNTQAVPSNYPYAECGLGNQQSPIDLKVAASEGVFNKLVTYYPQDKPDFFNSGHAAQVNLTDAYKGYLKIGQDKYPLIQFHFHAPSEHAYGNKLFDGELHFVHIRNDGKTIVLGIFLKAGRQSNKTLQTILNNMPESGQHNDDSRISIQPTLLLPKNSQQIYTYAGSLTTPPCSEGVIWYILSKPLEISKDQLSQLKALNQSNESYPNNNRLLQNLNSRVPTRLITK